MKTSTDCAWLRLVTLTILVWFGPSVLVIQQVHSWTEVRSLAWLLPVFPGVVAWHMGGGADSWVVGALITIGLVVGTFALAYRCQHRSSEWLPLVPAFLVSCLLWWEASALMAA
jgi:hypothetical protein